MKKHVVFLTGLVWLAVLSLTAAPWEPDLVAQIHFAGGAAVAADTNSTALKNVWSSPDALALRDQTLNKLSRSLDVWLHAHIAPTLTGSAPWPALLGDLAQSEWQLDLRQPTADTLEFALSVRLDNARAQAWQNDLTPVLTAWNSASPRHHARFTRTGGWLLLTLGNSPAPTSVGAIPGLKDAWLAADVDWGRLAAWYPELRKFDPPKTRLTVAGRNGNFEINGKLFLAQPLPSLAPWQFPTNTIHSPFVSFTAARGVSSWLKQQPWAVAIGLQTLPDEVFTWVMPQIAFQTIAAVPMASAPSELPRLERSLSAFLQAGGPDSPYKNFTLQTTNQQVTLVGLPFVAPYFEALHEPSGEFLLGGGFPNLPRGKPAPPELFARLDQPGLVFYHWEITSERMKIFPQLYQLCFVISRHRQLEVTSTAGKWLDHLAPTLGPTVTQAFETAPNELTFSRKAPAGLTALELVAFASWLEAPDFPGCNLRLPPPKIHRHTPKPPGTPAPGTPH
jgi:hypothetical protein